MKHNEVDHSILYPHSSLWKSVYLVVYVDDIVIIGDDITKISQLKQHLSNHFQTKDLGNLKYFLGIEVTQSKEDIVVRKGNMLLIS